MRRTYALLTILVLAGCRTFITRPNACYGFAKNVRDNIDEDEEAALKKLATALLTMQPQALAKALEAGEVMEVNCDA